MPRARKIVVDPETDALARADASVIRAAIAATLLPRDMDEVQEAASEIRCQRSTCVSCEKWFDRAVLIRALHEKGSPFYCDGCWQELAQAFLPIQDRSTRLNAYYLRTYGIGIKEYGDYYLRQCGRCAICERVPPRPLVVDHCHASGAVRGLLCQNCNSGLGMFRDDLAAMGRAIAYLVEMGRSAVENPPRSPEAERPAV